MHNDRDAVHEQLIVLHAQVRRLRQLVFVMFLVIGAVAVMGAAPGRTDVIEASTVRTNQLWVGEMLVVGARQLADKPGAAVQMGAGQGGAYVSINAGAAKMNLHASPDDQSFTISRTPDTLQVALSVSSQPTRLVVSEGGKRSATLTGAGLTVEDGALPAARFPAPAK